MPTKVTVLNSISSITFQGSALLSANSKFLNPSPLKSLIKSGSYHAPLIHPVHRSWSFCNLKGTFLLETISLIAILPLSFKTLFIFLRRLILDSGLTKFKTQLLKIISTDLSSINGFKSLSNSSSFSIDPSRNSVLLKPIFL